MEEITTGERYNFVNNYTSYNESTLCYWYNKINSRLNYLNPLLIELDSKGMELSKVSRELDQEVFEIIELKKLLELFKK